VPGTTRDILREHILIDGLPLHIIDTAGLRESGDPVEQEGVRRAWKEIESADRIILLHDATQVFDEKEKVLLESLLQAGPPMTLVVNKIDLPDNVKIDFKSAGASSEQVEIRVSAQTGEGLEQLKDHLKQCVGYQSGGEGQFMARRRHLEALVIASQHLEEGAKQLQEFAAGEILAEELRLAQQALGGITGEVTSDDLLGEIFSSFCIGK
jgi:tRNA modification GTPase